MSSLHSQTVLSLEDAITRALAQNPQLKMARNEAQQAANLATAGQAGLLPRVSLQGNHQRQFIQDAEVELAQFGGPENRPSTVELEGQDIQQNSTRAGLQVDYPLYNGGKARQRYEQLQRAARLSALEREMQAERTIYEVTEAYVAMARQQSRLEVLRRSLSVSRSRLERLREGHTYGQGNRLRVSQAEVDVENDSIALRQARLQRANARREINRLLHRAPENRFRVQTDLNYRDDLKLGELRDKALARNTRLMAGEEGVRLAKAQLAVQKAALKPRISLSGGYQYYREDNEIGQTLGVETLGLNAGVSVGFNLFNGGRVRNAVENARLERQRRALAREDAEDRVKSQLAQAYANYRHYQRERQAAQDNLPTFEQNYKRARRRYNNGQISATDVREAQLQLTRARNRLVNTAYQLKLAETRLLWLSGQLSTPAATETSSSNKHER
jgi:outer membrane protein TolC